MQRPVAVTGQVVVDVFGVDDAAVAEEDALLFAVEIDLAPLLDGRLVRGVLVQQPLHRPPADDVFGNDLRHVFGRHLRVEGLAGVDHHDGAHRAEAEAAGAPDLDLSAQPVFDELLVQGVAHLGAGRRSAACACTDRNHPVVGVMHRSHGFGRDHQITYAHHCPLALHVKRPAPRSSIVSAAAPAPPGADGPSPARRRRLRAPARRNPGSRRSPRSIRRPAMSRPAPRRTPV